MAAGDGCWHFHSISTMMSKGTGKKLAMALSLAQYTLAQSSNTLPGASSFVAPAGFPTTAFSTYYPVPSGQEPQPVLVDPVLNRCVPLKSPSRSNLANLPAVRTQSLQGDSDRDMYTDCRQSHSL